MNRRLPPGSIPSPAGLLASCDKDSNTLTLDGHGFETDTPVAVRALEASVLASPLVEGTTYYVIRLTSATFKLAATIGGSAIDITTDGGEMSISKEPDYDEYIEFYSRWADGLLPGHLVPLQNPIHPTVKGVVADCVAKRLLNIAGQESAILTSTELAGKAILERFATGLVLRGAPTTASANLAITNTLSRSTDPRGYGSGTLP